MKNLICLFTWLFLFGASCSLSSQALFEYYEHSEQSYGYNFMALDTSVVYLSNNPTGFGFSLKSVDYDSKEKEVLFDSQWYLVENSRFIRHSNDHWEFYTLSLIDYDIFVPIIYVIESINGEITTTEFNFWDEDCCWAILDMLQEDDGNYLILTADGIVRADEFGNILQVVLDQNSFWGGHFLKTTSGEFFAISTEGTVYQITNDLEFSFITSLPSNVQYIDTFNDSTLVASINEEFTFLTNRFEPSPSYAEFNKRVETGFTKYMIAKNNSVYFIQEENSETTVFSYVPEESSEFQILHEEPCIEIFYNKLDFWNDYIFEIGNLEFFPHPHIKSFSIDPTFDDHVERPKININDYQLYILDQYVTYDTIDNIVYQNNLTDYNYVLDYENIGSVDINTYDIYVSYNVNMWGQSGYLHTYEDDNFLSGEKRLLDESVTFDESQNTYYGFFIPDRVSLPGANFLPNCGINQWRDENVTTGTYILTVNDFSVFPNPSSGELYIRSESNLGEIEIIDQLGQTMIENNFNTNETHLFIDSWPSGMYYIKVGNRIKRIVKL